MRTNPSNIFELDERANDFSKSNQGFIYLDNKGDRAYFSFLQDNNIISKKIK